MSPQYSKSKFTGYTHRFIVKLSIDDDWRNDTDITIYSDSESREELEQFINEIKKPKVQSFKIVHRASKEQDEAASKFIDEVLKSI